VVFSDDGAWVDEGGHPACLPDDHSRVTVVRRTGLPIAAIVHDPDVTVESVELAAHLVGAHLDAQRAAALAHARTEAVRKAAGRLVRAGDQAAIEVSGRLTNGPIAELDAFTARLATDGGAVHQAPTVLRAVTAAVRQISHGVYPRRIDEGLSAVLRVPGTPVRRLPAAVEMTVYLLARDGQVVISDEGGHIDVARAADVPADP